MVGTLEPMMASSLFPLFQVIVQNSQIAIAPGVQVLSYKVCIDLAGAFAIVWFYADASKRRDSLLRKAFNKAQ
jgi:hypothetical protein